MDSQAPGPFDRVDPTVPHSARVWNYWLGGKDNYAADREAGDAFVAECPAIRDIARETRQWLGRVVRYLAGEVEVRQFLDIGTGLPTADNTHEIAQRTAPDARIVYADNDPLVLAHARALLTSTPEGATDYIDADMNDPETILAQAAKTLDLSRPVAVMLVGVMGHVDEDEDVLRIVRRLLAVMPPGSYLASCDGIDSDPVVTAAQNAYNEHSGGVPYWLRTTERVARRFEGLELIDPGMTELTAWRPDHADLGVPTPVPSVGAVARKPRP